jgi:hypothetical protein
MTFFSCKGNVYFEYKQLWKIIMLAFYGKKYKINNFSKKIKRNFLVENTYLNLYI